MEKSRGNSGGHLAVADMLRAIAVCGVVLNHFVVPRTMLYPLHEASDALGAWCVVGFFVLTGFLLGKPFVAALLGQRAFPSIWSYAARRFLRIWPPYAVAVIASASALVAHHVEQRATLADIVSHLTLLHGFSPLFIEGVGNRPLWTMAVDAEFYLLLPLGMFGALCMLKSRDPEQRARAFLVAVVLLIGVSLVVRTLTSTTRDDFWNSNAPAIFALERNAPGMFCAFGAGLILALRLVRNGTVAGKFWAPYLAAGILAEICAVAFTQAFPSSNAAERLLAYDILGTISATSVFIAGATLQEQVPAFVSMTTDRRVAGAAAISYAVYLVHWPLRQAVISFVLGRLHIPVSSVLFVIALIAITLPAVALAAFLLHVVVEKPCLQVKASLRDDKSRQIEVAVAPI